MESCSPFKYLKEDEYLLFDQDVKGVEGEIKGTLQNITIQKPNSKFVGTDILHRLRFYNLGKHYYDKRIAQDMVELSEIQLQYDSLVILEEGKWGERQEEHKLIAQSYVEQNDAKSLSKFEKQVRKDSLKHIKKVRNIRIKGNKKIDKYTLRIEEGNNLMRVWGEPPVIFDVEDTERSRVNMQRYLHSNGYLAAQVSSNLDTLGKKVYEKYDVVLGDPSLVRIVDYDIEDKELERWFNTSKTKSYIKEGEIFTEDNLDLERERIHTLMSENGYYDFTKAYIFFEVDTGFVKDLVDVNVLISNPANGDKHKKYTIQEVVFETDYQDRGYFNLTDTTYDRIRFYDGQNTYSKKVLAEKVAFRPGSNYNKIDAQRTRNNLGNIDIFKFVNVNYEKIGEDSLRAKVAVTSLDKWQYALEFGLNVNQSIPGPFSTISLKKRNIFGGAEVFEAQGRFAFDTQVTSGEPTTGVYNSTEYSVNFSFQFPRLAIPMSYRMRRSHFSQSARSRLLFSMASIDRPEYTRYNLKGALTYQWRNQKNNHFNFTILDFNLINTRDISAEFQQRLQTLNEQGNTLSYSFESSILTGVNGSYSRMKGNYGRGSNKSSYLTLYGEMSGNLLNLLANQMAEEKAQEGIINGLRYYQYVKLYADYRQIVPLGKHQVFASRFHAGIAYAYGSNISALPYEKYFFTGGGNSNRAWQARRVGPGSYTPEINENGTFAYTFEQPGDIIIESNFEWRSKIWNILHGALFVDASNVWTIRDDPSRPGAQFKVNEFWKEFAIGSGVGLRLDFSYLLIRLDAGMKIYDPARREGDRFIIAYEWFAPGQVEYNLSIGYPF